MLVQWKCVSLIGVKPIKVVCFKIMLPPSIANSNLNSDENWILYWPMEEQLQTQSVSFLIGNILICHLAKKKFKASCRNTYLLQKIISLGSCDISFHLTFTVACRRATKKSHPHCYTMSHS